MSTCTRYPHMRWRKKSATMEPGKTFPFQCQSWSDADCAASVAKFYRWRIGGWCEVYDLSRFMTLTLDMKKIHNPNNPYSAEIIAEARSQGMQPGTREYKAYVSWRYIKESWNRFGTTMRRKYPGFKYVAVMEPHDSEKTAESQRGVFHIHALVNKYIWKNDLKKYWRRAGGGGTDINQVKDVRRVRWYVTKYITKISTKRPEDWPKRARRIFTSRAIMIRYYPADLGVKKGGMLDRDNLPWVDCWPGENFENCAKCKYRRDCAAHVPEYELLISGVAAHDPPQRWIALRYKHVHVNEFLGYVQKRFVEEVTMTGCLDLPAYLRPCKGCIHIAHCRANGQPYLPEYHVDPTTGEATTVYGPIREGEVWNTLDGYAPWKRGGKPPKVLPKELKST